MLVHEKKNIYRCEQCGKRVTHTTDATGLPCPKCQQDMVRERNQGRERTAPKRESKPCVGCGDKKTAGELVQEVWSHGWNFTKAVASWAGNGFRTATEEEYDARRAICTACPKLASFLGADKCGECGCFIAAKAAVVEKPGSSDCPLEHWPKTERPPRVIRPDPAKQIKSVGKLAESAFNDSLPQPFTGPVTRHLLFHCAPYKAHGGAVWRRHAEQLRKRLHLFNGRRVVAIVTQDDMDPPDEVQRVYEGIADKFIVTPNVQKPVQLREVATHEMLWGEIPLDDPNGITFYAHTKGATKPVNRGVTVHRWGEMMYETLLDYPALIEQTLQQYHCAGSFQKVGRFFFRSGWHYSGTFYWMRNHQLATREWRRIDKAWWGTEAWPSVHFKAAQAACIFYKRKGMNMYNMRDLLDAEKELEAWKKEHERYRISS